MVYSHAGSFLSTRSHVRSLSSQLSSEYVRNWANFPKAEEDVPDLAQEKNTLVAKIFLYITENIEILWFLFQIYFLEFSRIIKDVFQIFESESEVCEEREFVASLSS